jgi:glutathione S-transferase
VSGTLTVEQARELPGLRLVLTTGVPGPWGESAKGFFQVKKVPFHRVAQQAGQPNQALYEWTGCRNAPVAVYEGQPSRSGWAEILFLAERIAPEPALIPEDPVERALMFGLAHEICGEQGFGWSRRLMLLHGVLARLPADPPPSFDLPVELGRRYGYSPGAAERASARVAQILELLSSRLRDQRARGSHFFVGERLSALDIQWAAFAAMVEPLPEALCPMNPMMRAGYTLSDQSVRAHCDPILLEHRDLIYQRYLELPVQT